MVSIVAMIDISNLQIGFVNGGLDGHGVIQKER
jgi:lipid-binding SYLF domain-containing protein